MHSACNVNPSADENQKSAEGIFLSEQQRKTKTSVKKFIFTEVVFVFSYVQSLAISAFSSSSFSGEMPEYLMMFSSDIPSKIMILAVSICCLRIPSS